MHIDDLASLRFAFCGNRFFVLEELFRARLNVVSVAAVRGSHLERTLAANGTPHCAIWRKAEFLEWLDATPFDVFVSNGCPYIVPPEQVARGDRLFVNVHPSYLPDLRGADPVPGALLMGRDAGATCHVMDAGIDTGDLISRVAIPYSADLDAAFLYQLSFLAEKEVFRLALDRRFQPMGPQEAGADLAYYSKSSADLDIDWSASAEDIVRRVRAFSNRSQGARFVFDGNDYRCFDAELVTNLFLVARKHLFQENRISLCCEDAIIVRKGDVFVKLKRIEGDLSRLRVGGVLG